MNAEHEVVHKPTHSVYEVRNGRRKMEDRHVIITDLNSTFNLDLPHHYGYYAIFDGHNGADAAVYASENLHKYLIQMPAFSAGRIDDALKDAMMTTDSKFCEENQQCGCTALVALIEDQRRLYVAWLGDSGAVMIRNGEPILLTRSHTADREDERERVQQFGGECYQAVSDSWRVMGTLQVTRSIGDATFKPFVSGMPDVGIYDLEGNEDFLVLGCDGLLDHLGPFDVSSIVYEYLTVNAYKQPEVLVEEVAQILSQKAIDEGSKDNITTIVLFLRPLRDIIPYFGKPAESNGLSNESNGIQNGNHLIDVQNEEKSTNGHYENGDHMHTNGSGLLSPLNPMAPLFTPSYVTSASDFEYEQISEPQVEEPQSEQPHSILEPYEDEQVQQELDNERVQHDVATQEILLEDDEDEDSEDDARSQEGVNIFINRDQIVEPEYGIIPSESVATPVDLVSSSSESDQKPPSASPAFENLLTDTVHSPFEDIQDQIKDFVEKESDGLSDNEFKLETDSKSATEDNSFVFVEKPLETISSQEPQVTNGDLLGEFSSEQLVDTANSTSTNASQENESAYFEAETSLLKENKENLNGEYQEMLNDDEDKENINDEDKENLNDIGIQNETFNASNVSEIESSQNVLSTHEEELEKIDDGLNQMHETQQLAEPEPAESSKIFDEISFEDPYFNTHSQTIGIEPQEDSFVVQKSDDFIKGIDQHYFGHQVDQENMQETSIPARHEDSFEKVDSSENLFSEKEAFEENNYLKQENGLASPVQPQEPAAQTEELISNQVQSEFSEINNLESRQKTHSFVEITQEQFVPQSENEFSDKNEFENHSSMEEISQFVQNDEPEIVKEHYHQEISNEENAFEQYVDNEQEFENENSAQKTPDQIQMSESFAFVTNNQSEPQFVAEKNYVEDFAFTQNDQNEINQERIVNEFDSETPETLNEAIISNVTTHEPSFLPEENNLLTNNIAYEETAASEVNDIVEETLINDQTQIQNQEKAAEQNKEEVSQENHELNDEKNLEFGAQDQDKIEPQPIEEVAVQIKEENTEQNHEETAEQNQVLATENNHELASENNKEQLVDTISLSVDETPKINGFNAEELKFEELTLNECLTEPAIKESNRVEISEEIPKHENEMVEESKPLEGSPVEPVLTEQSANESKESTAITVAKTAAKVAVVGVAAKTITSKVASMTAKSKPTAASKAPTTSRVAVTSRLTAARQVSTAATKPASATTKPSSLATRTSTVGRQPATSTLRSTTAKTTTVLSRPTTMATKQSATGPTSAKPTVSSRYANVPSKLSTRTSTAQPTNSATSRLSSTSATRTTSTTSKPTIAAKTTAPTRQVPATRLTSTTTSRTTPTRLSTAKTAPKTKPTTNGVASRVSSTRPTTTTTRTTIPASSKPAAASTAASRVAAARAAAASMRHTAAKTTSTANNLAARKTPTNGRVPAKTNGNSTSPQSVPRKAVDKKSPAKETETIKTNGNVLNGDHAEPIEPKLHVPSSKSRDKLTNSLKDEIEAALELNSSSKEPVIAEEAI